VNYFGKNERLLSLVSGKRILHLGCVGFTDTPTRHRVALAQQSLHYALTQAGDVVGIDYSKDEIDYYAANGVFRNIVHGNVEHLEALELDQTFDVVVAGDIIEHLSNPGLMLEGIKRFCKPTSVLIVTTPNAFGVLNFLRYVAGRFHEGKEHVMTFNRENIATLLTRHGYQIESIDTCFQKQASSRGLLFTVGKKLLELFPKLGGTLFVAARMQRTG
jgi:2-polyprenyl-3-methyl-5-hydroxy-6-metoxy-1,4-benzoquinol methylase